MRTAMLICWGGATYGLEVERRRKKVDRGGSEGQGWVSGTVGI